MYCHRTVKVKNTKEEKRDNTKEEKKGYCYTRYPWYCKYMNAKDKRKTCLLMCMLYIHVCRGLYSTSDSSGKQNLILERLRA